MGETLWRFESSRPHLNRGRLAQWQSIAFTLRGSEVQILQRPSMSEYLVKLIDKKEVARKTTAFFFEKPKEFKFIPGQFIEIHINKNLTHEFSITSSPKEKELIIATRMRQSVFKNSLKKLKIGSKIRIEGPFGQLAIHKNKQMTSSLP